MVQALGQSCDVYFYDLARRVGIDAIADMASRFGLGQPAGHRPAGRAAGPDPDHATGRRRRLGESWQKGETLVCGIGQGFVWRPAAAGGHDARLANGGLGVTPWLVRRRRRAATRSPSGSPEPPRRGAARHARGGPRRPRHRPAADLGLPGVEMGGKTGTSQVRRISGPSAPPGATSARTCPGSSATMRCSSAAPLPATALRRVGDGRARQGRLEGGVADRARHHAQGAGARPGGRRAPTRGGPRRAT